MVLRVNTRESRSSPGQPKTDLENNPALTKNTKAPLGENRAGLLFSWPTGSRHCMAGAGKQVRASTMTSVYLPLKLAHVLGGAILFGAGIAVVLFMAMALRTGDSRLLDRTVRVAGIADLAFIAPMMFLQPVTGTLLLYASGHSVAEIWLRVSIGIYVAIGACWLSLIWIYDRMDVLSQAAAESAAPPSDEFRRTCRIWFLANAALLLGAALLFALMILKPF